MKRWLLRLTTYLPEVFLAAVFLYVALTSIDKHLLPPAAAYYLLGLGILLLIVGRKIDHRQRLKQWRQSGKVALPLEERHLRWLNDFLNTRVGFEDEHHLKWEALMPGGLRSQRWRRQVYVAERPYRHYQVTVRPIWPYPMVALTTLRISGRLLPGLSGGSTQEYQDFCWHFCLTPGSLDVVWRHTHN